MASPASPFLEAVSRKSLEKAHEGESSDKVGLPSTRHHLYINRSPFIIKESEEREKEVHNEPPFIESGNW